MHTTSSVLALKRGWTWGMVRSTVMAWCLLLVTDVIVACGGAPALFRLIRACPVRRRSSIDTARTPDEVLAALRQASVFAVHQYHCLKYRTAGTCLLRLHGHPASFVIGVRRHPFRSHAWLEYSGGCAGVEPHEVAEWIILFRA